MTRIPLLFFCFLSLTSCGQQTGDKDIYNKMVSEICSCSQAYSGNKVSRVIDSCYKASTLKNYAELQKLGIDSATQEGKNKLYNAVMTNNFRLKCKDVFAKLMKEVEAYNAGKLTFTGKLISQTLDKEKKYYIIILQSPQTKEKKEFHSLMDISKDSQNDELTIEYEIKKDAATGLQELVVISISAIGIRTVK